MIKMNNKAISNNHTNGLYKWQAIEAFLCIKFFSTMYYWMILTTIL
jgi:hypothetical protein